MFRQDSCHAGFTAALLQHVGFIAALLRNAGFIAALLQHAGFTAGLLQHAGFQSKVAKPLSRHCRIVVSNILKQHYYDCSFQHFWKLPFSF